MISYKLCSEVDIDKIYQAFQIGYSDYLIPLQISKEEFVKRFLGLEGNKLNYSYIAMDGDKAVGLILGGIKNYEGVKTLRCGTLCIHPEYRGKGVSKKLFELHKEIGVENKCKQLSLEVVVGNDRAIRFYEKCGYEKVYDLFYYTHKELNNVANKKGNIDYTINEIDIDILKKLSNNFYDIHINWQNDMDYMEKLEGQLYYGAYDKEQLIGAISASPGGKIYFLWVSPEYRSQGIATNLLYYYLANKKPETLYFSFPNNRALHAFVQYHNFKRDIMQYEMYLTL